jgi:dehydrogenase/reductase SDR family protein 7B
LTSTVRSSFDARQESFVAKSFSGKVAWLTGASSGIGEALAYALAAEGANLVLTARRERELERVRGACERPQSHLTLPVDLFAPDTFPAAVQAVLDRCGHIDVLVHCAGISQRGKSVGSQMQVDRQVMELNHFAPVALTKLVLPSMIERRSGHIVAISSLLGKFGAPGRAAYSASKHAVIGHFDSLRAEVHRHGIRVTVICPGFVRTNASYNALNPDGTPHGQMEDHIRHGMASDECARQIVRAIRGGKREVYIGRERWAVYLERFMPGLFNRLIRRQKFK